METFYYTHSTRVDIAQFQKVVWASGLADHVLWLIEKAESPHTSPLYVENAYEMSMALAHCIRGFVEGT